MWSPGLKARFGIAEKSDADLAADDAPDDVPELTVLRAWFGSSAEWKAARKRSCALLHAARSGGNLIGPSSGQPMPCSGNCTAAMRSLNRQIKPQNVLQDHCKAMGRQLHITTGKALGPASLKR